MKVLRLLIFLAMAGLPLLTFNGILAESREMPYSGEREIIFNPKEVTPPYLNFSPKEIRIAGNYAYIAAGINGLHIFDISSPENTRWVAAVRGLDRVRDVAISGNHAFALGDNFTILDISTPKNAYIVKAIERPNERMDGESIDVSNGYAYATTYFHKKNFVRTSGITIFDIDPVESAKVINSVELQGEAKKVRIFDGYAYVTFEKRDTKTGKLNYGIAIIDVDPPEKAHIVETVGTLDETKNLDFSDGYAFVATRDSGLKIFNVESPQIPKLIKSIYSNKYICDMHVSGDYVFLLVAGNEVRIIEISDLKNPKVIKKVKVQSYSQNFEMSGGYAYIIGPGLQSLDIELLEDSHVVKSIDTFIYAGDVIISNGYAYVASGGDFQIVKIDPVESSHIIKTVPGGYMNFQVVDGYAYLTSGKGLRIITLNPPEKAHVVKEIETPSDSLDVRVSGGYAYVCYAGNNDNSKPGEGLAIIDINPPEEAHLIKSVETPYFSGRFDVSNGYAFMDCFQNLHIIDIDPPEDAKVVATVGKKGSLSKVSDGYVYIVYHGVQIWDIDPPEESHLVKTIELPDQVNFMYIWKGNLFVPLRSYKNDQKPTLYVIDITPPESAHIIRTIETETDCYQIHFMDRYAFSNGDDGIFYIFDIDPPESAHIVASNRLSYNSWGFDIWNGYAFLADNQIGLRIFKLW